jgi:hypothetical protein
LVEAGELLKPWMYINMIQVAERSAALLCPTGPRRVAT